MAVKLIDLQLIYGVAGARAQFEDLAAALIKAEQPKADKVRTSRGDGGIDVHVGDLTSPDGIEVFQCKFFPQGLDESQKGQIRESFKTCRAKHKLLRWTLCLPLDLSTEEKVWFETWRTGQAEHGIEIADPWGATTLESLLFKQKNQGLREVFFKEEHLTQIRELHTMFTRLVPDIMARLQEGPATQAREADAQARQAEYLSDFRKSLRTRFIALTQPKPVRLSEVQQAKLNGDRERATKLLDAGKRHGHWEIVISPSRIPEQPRLQSLKDCRTIVEACQVRSHGWEFPASTSNSQETGTDWLGFFRRHSDEGECWRISQRGVFANMLVVFDDLRSPPQLDQRWASRMPAGFIPKKFLDIEVAVRTITHGFRFAARLAEKTLDPAAETVHVLIHLSGTRDRVLVTRGDTGRLNDWYIASVPFLENSWACNRGELNANPDAFAVRAALWFFERFNWQFATEEIVAKTQARVFSGG
jgi:hypothetical protein